MSNVENYQTLAEEGFDIEQCFLDFKTISIACEDITRYKKAFRVKIRGLIKEGKSASLSECIDNFYRFALFVEYLYGDHSCATGVSPWQAETARSLQKQYSDAGHYRRGERMEYAAQSSYEKHFREHFALLDTDNDKSSSEFIQDNKPFLTLKDYAHFERWF